MKKTLLAIALAAATTTAFADTTLSGHINTVLKDTTELGDERLSSSAATSSDDKYDQRVSNQTTSPSRFRILSSKKAGGVTWGTRFEFGVTDSALNTRNSFVYAKGGFGKIGLGKQSEVGDGYAERDMSGTYVLTGNTGVYRAGGTRDGDRTSNLRYDSPKLGPATISASFSEDEINLGLDVKLKTVRFSLYSESNESDTASDEIGGSVAAKFGIFTAAVQAAVLEDNTPGNDDDTEQFDVILGIKTGKISAAVDFGESDAGDGADALEYVGLSFVYRPTKGVELYAGARGVEQGDADGTAYAFGSRIKF